MIPLVSLAAVTVLAANPPLPRLPRGPSPEGKEKSNQPRDIFDLMRLSQGVVRARVGTPVSSGDRFSTIAVHVDHWLKGDGGSDLEVTFPGTHPITDPGNDELLFLAPGPRADGGGPVPPACIQAPSDRWLIPDGATGAVDVALSDAVRGAPQAQVLTELVKSTPQLAIGAADTLAMMAGHDPSARSAAAAVVSDKDADPQARILLMEMAPSQLPVEVLTQSLDASQPANVRIAAAGALGHSASNEPSRRAVSVETLQRTLSDPDERVEFEAARGLAILGKESSLPTLQKVLDGHDQPLRREAVRALAALSATGSEAAAQKLDSLKGDSDPEVAKRAKNLSAPPPQPAASRRSRAWPLIAAFGALVSVLLILGVVVRRRRPRA